MDIYNDSIIIIRGKIHILQVRIKYCTALIYITNSITLYNLYGIHLSSSGTDSQIFCCREFNTDQINCSLKKYLKVLGL